MCLRAEGLNRQEVSQRCSADDVLCAHRLMWRLRQSNQTHVAQVLAEAERVGTRGNVDDIVAKALAWASQRGTVGVNQLLGFVRLSAQADQLGRLANAMQASGAASGSVALRAALDTEIHITRRMVDNVQRNSDAPPAPASASSITPPRTNAQVQVAYNHPAHWLLRPSGQFAPDPIRIAGESAQAWARLTSKFGEPLAERLFDVGVRGGVMPQIDLLDAAHSNKSLSLRDAAELQGIARSDGKTGELKLTLHDVGHNTTGYGPAPIQETAGDHFAEFLLTDLFGDKSYLDRIPPAFREALQLRIDANRPLSEQPAVMRDLPAVIDKHWRRTGADQLGWEVQKLFYTRLPVEIFMTQLNQDWTGRSPSENARELEKVLTTNGQLAHLGPQARARIAKLIYPTDGYSSFASICKNFDPATKPESFQRMFVDWVRDRLTPALVKEASLSTITNEEFRSRAADAVAQGLMLERAAPGVLLNSPIGRPLAEAEQTPALRDLDLRVAYPPVRAEVRRALGLGL
jgi:hypothetical protein